MITREQGKRFIAVKFSVREDRDLASAVEEVQEKTRHLIQPPYRVAFGGEFEQMKDAEARLMLIIPASLILISLLLYIAFRSLLDATVVLSNVFDLAVGGIWSLYFTGTNFSISAAVGFVSLFGVAIMDGLLLISYFNDLRGKGLPVNEAIMEGAAKRVRPVMMTALTAILGLLPAAFSTAIGAQTQRPLAIVVVGGMLTTLFLTRYLMPVLYSFYGHREPPAGASSLSHWIWRPVAGGAGTGRHSGLLQRIRNGPLVFQLRWTPGIPGLPPTLRDVCTRILSGHVVRLHGVRRARRVLRRRAWVHHSNTSRNVWRQTLVAGIRVV